MKLKVEQSTPDQDVIVFQDDTRGPHCYRDQEPGTQEEAEIRDF